MELTVLAFAHARDTFGFSSRIVSCDPADTPRMILQRLAPAAELDHLAVAVNGEYGAMDRPVGPAAVELAIIPPVSGG